MKSALPALSSLSSLSSLFCYAAFSAIVAPLAACSSNDSSGGSSESPAPAGGGDPSSGGNPTTTGGSDAGPNGSADAGAPADAGPVSSVGTETWSDGKQITSNLDIAADATVTIAPGATITVAAGVTITVHGTLTASAKASHAKLTGTGWNGIVVASGGTLALVGVDMSGAGIETNAGDKGASYDYGTITSGIFSVDAGSTFVTDHAAVVQGGSSTVSGAFTATFLDYSGLAIVLSNDAATVSIADSKLTGGGTGTDFIIADAGKLLHVEYSTITSSHCPFHFNTLATYTFDHVGTQSDGYGEMLYNAGTGTSTISYSSFNDPNFEQTDNMTTVKIDHSYIADKKPTTLGIVTITAPAASPIAAAAPRGTPGPNG